MATQIAGGNGVALIGLVWPEGSRWPPTTVQVTVEAVGPAGTRIRAAARAAVAPGAGSLPEAWSAGGAGQYSGPLVLRDGKPTCPAVAAAFDRMDAAAHRDGIDLVVNSAFRTDAEQAVLFRRHPDPRWVAPPGRSRHRQATELDLGGSAARGRGSRATHAPSIRQRDAWGVDHGYFGCGGDAEPTVVLAAAWSAGLPPWSAAYRRMVVEARRRGACRDCSSLRCAGGWIDRWWVRFPVGARGIVQFTGRRLPRHGARDRRPV